MRVVKTKERECEFEPCKKMFEAKQKAGGTWGAWCPDCVKNRVWFGGNHSLKRIKELNAEKGNKDTS